MGAGNRKKHLEFTFAQKRGGWVARATKRAREIGWQATHTKTGPLHDVVNKFYKYTPNVTISSS